jgi:hypothetical protein
MASRGEPWYLTREYLYYPGYYTKFHINDAARVHLKFLNFRLPSDLDMGHCRKRNSRILELKRMAAD